jgi:predicted RNA-binding protein associated with RNAse of E/G family
MLAQKYFVPGQTILLRELWRGKIWSARSAIVVKDEPELTALFMPIYTPCKYPRTPEGQRVKAKNRLHSKWMLADEQNPYHSLKLTVPGVNYAVVIYWETPGMKQRSFYINMEEPVARNTQGFDYLDQWLDAIVKPDLSSWHWKDEDELAEAIELGLVSKEQGAAMYEEGEKAARWIQSGKSPFNGWEKWRPDPPLKAPALPEGWELI